MSTEMEKFDPSKLMQGIRERIQATFVALIPDEQWDKMIAGIIEKFTKPREATLKNNYNGTDRVTIETSEFEELVVAELKTYLKPKVADYIEKNYQGKWEYDPNKGSGYTVHKNIEQIIVDNSDLIMKKIIADTASQLIMELRNRIRSGSF